MITHIDENTTGFLTLNGWTKAGMIEALYGYLPPEGRATRNGVCAYSTVIGHRCAIGAFIPPDREDALKHRGGVTQLVDVFPSLADSFPLGRVGLSALQATHDSWDEALDGGTPRSTVIAWVEKNVIDEVTA